jgi:hypothetical protein
MIAAQELLFYLQITLISFTWSKVMWLPPTMIIAPSKGPIGSFNHYGNPASSKEWQLPSRPTRWVDK